MIKIENVNIDLDNTIACGQIFRYVKKKDNSYTIILSDRVVNIKKEDNNLIVKSNDEENIESIIRNYLVKTVAYKTNIKFLDIRICQSKLDISFNKDVLQFDNENKVTEKEYNKGSSKYHIEIKSYEECDYVINLIKKLYIYISTPHNKISDELYDNLKFKVLTLSEDVLCNVNIKDTTFKTRRNFLSILKCKNWLFIRILKLNDNKLFNIIDTSVYGALCMTYKIKSNEDIDMILPFIKQSLEISRINPIDYNNNLHKLYYNGV